MGKGGIMMVIGKPKADDAEEMGESDGQDSSDSPSLSDVAGRKAAKGVLAAIEASDPGALDKALRAHYEACGEEE